MTEPMTDAPHRPIDVQSILDRLRSIEPHTATRRTVTIEPHDATAILDHIGAYAEHCAAIEARLDAERSRADAAEAARDAALARAMPEPVLMETVEQVEALAVGNYLVRFAAIAGVHSTERDETDPPGALVWYVPGDASQWPDGAFVGAWISGPLPDLPIPTPGDAP